MSTEQRQKKKWRIAKTARPKNIVIDNKAYVKCPYPDCGFTVEDDNWGNIPRIRIRDHVREVHKLVWMRAGKTAGWYPLSKFYRRGGDE